MWELVTTVIAAVIGGLITAALPRVRRAFDLIGSREGRLMTTVEWNLRAISDLPDGPGRDSLLADTDLALSELVEIRRAAVPRRSNDPQRRRGQLRKDSMSSPLSRVTFAMPIVFVVLAVIVTVLSYLVR